MRLRKVQTFTLAFLAAVGGLALTSTASTAAPAEPAAVTAADSYVDAGDGPTGVVPAELENGTIAELTTGTRFKMICWYDRGITRWFYGEITSGRYQDHYTNLAFNVVADQKTVPHCD